MSLLSFNWLTPNSVRCVLVFVLLPLGVLSQSPLRSDTAYLSSLRRAEQDSSQVMEILLALTDINGPRLTNSQGFESAAAYAKRALESWGIQHVHFDYWGEVFGTGWELRKFSLEMTGPAYSPIIAWPKAWSRDVAGVLRAAAVYLDVASQSDLENYKGKLRGKVILLDPPVPAPPSFKPDAWRHADSTLEEMARAKASGAYRGRQHSPSAAQRLTWLKWDFCISEGAAAILEPSSRLEDDGTLVVGAATIPYPPEVPYGRRAQPWDAGAPETPPQVVVAAEHYNRMVRQLEKNVPVTLALTFQADFTPPREGFNVIGEIPGTDLTAEVVMIGAHLDSWHSATGATDNAAGAAVMMEAMRLIQSMGVKPRRTIRLALWGGEEQGLLGSRAYVKRKLGERFDRSYPYDSIALTPAGRNFSVYFNMDYGAGKYRGIYLQGNEAALAPFSKWMKYFERDSAATISLRNATGTDHLSFDAIGLPAFQFIQDPLEYATRTHHANMDLFDKVIASDLRHNAMMTAFLAWMAANSDERIPRDNER